jgi:hypothetical protein
VQSQADADCFDSCPFFRLPLELRQQVYRLALPQSISPCAVIPTDATKLQKNLLRNPESRTTNDKAYLWRSGNLGLLTVNQQINAEATSIFWSENVFNVIINDAHPHLIIPYDNRSNRGSFSRRKPRGVKSSPAFTMSRDMKEIEDVPTEYLRQVRHVCIVMRRGSDMFYEPDIGQLLATPSRNENIAETEECKNIVAEEKLLQKMLLLDQGFKAVRSALNLSEPFLSKRWRYQTPTQSRCAILSAEVIIYPILHTRKGSVVPVMDPVFVQKAGDCFHHLPKQAQRLMLLSLSYGRVNWLRPQIPRSWPLCQSARFHICELPATPQAAAWVCYGKKGGELKPRLMVTLRTQGSRA